MGMTEETTPTPAPAPMQDETKPEEHKPSE